MTETRKNVRRIEKGEKKSRFNVATVDEYIYIRIYVHRLSLDRKKRIRIVVEHDLSLNCSQSVTFISYIYLF